MATKSFTDTYVIERKDVNRFHNIMKNSKKVKVRSDVEHQDAKGNDILKILGINKK